MGEDPEATIIDGEGTETVVKVTANNVNITGFTIRNGGDFPYAGLFVGNCSGSEIRNNIVRNNAYGIELLETNGSSVIDNTIMNNSWCGIYIHDSNENLIHSNTIANNSIGAWIPSSTIPNTFYRNNFIDNPSQVFAPASTNWDNGTEGNYWDEYNGTDTNGDGIGNTDIPHQGVDYYPLIIPTRPFPILWDNIIYQVALLSNSTVSRFRFNQPSKKIGFYVTGFLSTTGFCNVTIPKQLLRNNPWTVLLDEVNITSQTTIIENETHSTLCLTYAHSTYKVQIIGTEVVPEFSTAVFLQLFITVTLATATLVRRRKKRKSES